MRGNTVFVVVLLLNTMSDQLLNIALEMFYDTFGVEGTFKVWWGWHLFIFINLHIIAPIMIICNAYKNFLEFRGFEPKVFPGQEAPRSIPVLPHRAEVIQLEELKVARKKTKNKQNTARNTSNMVRQRIKVYKLMPPIHEGDDSLTTVIIH